MSEPNKDAPFTGLERHAIGQFQFPLIKRKETYEETLGVYDPENRMGLNKNTLARTTHLYRNNADVFGATRQILEQDKSFTKVKIAHQASDLGLPYKIVASHSSGASIEYDGLLFRVTYTITEKNFRPSEIDDLAGYPKPMDTVIEAFGAALRTSIPKLIPMYHSTISFYTVGHVNWKPLGVTPVEDAQVRLVCTDPKFITITALIFSEMGKNYDIYFGNRDRILQMLAHDFQTEYELSEFSSLFHEKLGAVNRIRESSIGEFAGVIAPFRDLSYKHHQWNLVKDNLRFLLKVKQTINRAELLTTSVQDIIEKCWAYFNGPKQIWLPGEEMENQTKIQHPCTQFFEARLQNGNVKFESTEPTQPMYARTFETLKKKVELLKSATGEAYEVERDLLTAFQTEFSIYAVWIAVITLIASVIVSVILSMLAR